MPPTVANIDKAAVLLNQLEPKARDKVLEILGAEFAGKLRPIIAAVKRRKDWGELSESVLQEFRELQQDVRDSVSDSPERCNTFQSSLAAATGVSRAEATESKFSQNSADGATATGESPPATEVTATPKPAPTAESASEDVDSLAKLPPAIVAAAMKPESPRMIATVLKNLPTEVSGKILEALPLEIRNGVFLLMADTVQVNPAVIRRVMQRLLEECRTVDPSVVEKVDRRVKTLIGVLQTVEREERLRLLESLTEQDPDLASQIDDLMYDYTDILRIEDRSVQKLLGQLEQKVVAMALKTAPEDLRQKVLKNLSERVRLALNEEMELLPGITAAKADAARREIANVIRGQDKEGSLVWME